MPAHPMCVRLSVLLVTTLMFCQVLHAIPLRVLAWDEAIAARKLAIVDAKNSVAIEAMHPSKRTKAYPVTVGEKPVLLQALDKTDKDGKPAASAVIIPQGTKQPLLLLLPDAKAATGLRLLVLDDDAANFAWGAFRFINASGKKLALVIEKKGVTLPASWTPVAVNPGGENRNMEVKIFFFDEPAVPVYTAVWEQQQDVRTLIFLVPGEDPRLGPVAMKMIPEDRRAIEAAPPVTMARPE